MVESLSPDPGFMRDFIVDKFTAGKLGCGDAALLCDLAAAEPATPVELRSSLQAASQRFRSKDSTRALCFLSGHEIARGTFDCQRCGLDVS